MSLETEIARLATAIEENTRTMRELAGQTTITTLPVKPTKAKAEKPAPVVTEPEPAEAPAPVVEEPVKNETVDADPGDPEPTTTGDDDYDSWDEAKLRLATQEYIKGRLIDTSDADRLKSFKESFTAELAKYGVEKAARLAASDLPAFYRAALTW